MNNDATAAAAELDGCGELIAALKAACESDTFRVPSPNQLGEPARLRSAAGEFRAVGTLIEQFAAKLDAQADEWDASINGNTSGANWNTATGGKRSSRRRRRSTRKSRRNK